MKALYLTTHFKRIEDLVLPISERPSPKLKVGECLVKIASAGVNPSDVLATLGYFPHAKLPRIPGRDFSGVVVEGSSRWIGQSVWGTGGAAGVDFDGTHAEFLLLSESAIAEIPHNLTLLQAGAQTLPYVTAYYSLVTRAKIQAGETVLVIGALGQVGSAAMSLCAWKGCKPIGLVRTEEDVQTAKSLNWEAIHTLPSSQTFDVILNTIGNPGWDDLLNSLKPFGRMVVIAAPEGKRDVRINLLNLYRANKEIIGINTIDLDYSENAKLLQKMRPGFESGALTPLPLDSSSTFPMTMAHMAYKKVLTGSGGKRVVLTM